MWTEIASLLACPICGECLGLSERNSLLCPVGHGPFSVEGGVPRLLPAEVGTRPEQRTLRAFERQWRAWSDLPRIFGKDAAAMAANLQGARLSARIDKAWYEGRRVLDAGCGHGRYLGLFREMGAEVVGLDAGRGPELARVPLDQPGLSVVQGSVLSLPFRDESFDLVFSDGVIHHTPDPAQAYAELARVAKPGGAVYVWVYPQEGWLREAVFGTARVVTTRLPGAAVKGVSFFLAPLTLFVRSYSGTRLGRATWSECAQVVHDWLAPPLQSHHTWEEVQGWAAAASLVDVERLPVPIGMTAWKKKM